MSERLWQRDSETFEYSHIRRPRAFATQAFDKLKARSSLQGNFRRVLPEEKPARLQRPRPKRKELFLIALYDRIGRIAKDDIAGGFRRAEGKNISLVNLEREGLHTGAFAYGGNVTLDNDGKLGMALDKDAGLRTAADSLQPHRATTSEKIYKHAVWNAGRQRVEDRLAHLIGGRTQLG